VANRPYYCPVPWSETLPQVSLVGTLLTVLLLFFAAVGEPLLGRRAYAWLSRSRFDDERSLKLLHAVTMGVHVLWGLLVLLVVLLSPGLAANDLGLRLPHAVGPVVGGAIGGLVALALFWVLVNGVPSRERLLPAKLAERMPEGKKRGSHKGRRAADRPMTLPEPGRRVEELLYPRTRAEQATAAGTAVTSGFFAELLYRGLFITLIASLGLPLFVAALLSIMLFSLAHVYQGWWGAAHGALTGTLFTVLYLGTGSLWVPIVVHAALNIRSMVFPPASAAPDDDWYYDDDYYDYDDYPDTGEMAAVDAEEPAAGEPGRGAVPVPASDSGTPPEGTPSWGVGEEPGNVPGIDAPSWRIDPVTGSFGDHTSWESGVAQGAGGSSEQPPRAGEPRSGPGGPVPGEEDPGSRDRLSRDNPQAYWDMLDDRRDP